jgi:hypothetical protein
LSWLFSLGNSRQESKDDDVIDVPHKIVK